MHKVGTTAVVHNSFAGSMNPEGALASKRRFTSVKMLHVHLVFVTAELILIQAADICRVHVLHQYRKVIKKLGLNV
jgi:hypothetical protein